MPEPDTRRYLFGNPRYPVVMYYTIAYAVLVKEAYSTFGIADTSWRDIPTAAITFLSF